MAGSVARYPSDVVVATTEAMKNECMIAIIAVEGFPEVALLFLG